MFLSGQMIHDLLKSSLRYPRCQLHIIAKIMLLMCLGKTKVLATLWMVCVIWLGVLPLQEHASAYIKMLI